VSNTNYDERDLCLDILKCLIKEPNAQVNLQDYENKTPLHYAERLKTIEVLLTREDIDPLVKDDSGKTPFDYAKPEIKKTLMSNKYGSEKNSLLHFATITGTLALIIALMISEMSKRYIENEFQKKMFMELEECGGINSTVNNIEIEPIMSRCRQ
ncbi:MAG: hypothetical protein ACEY3M_22655, partial [Wolbachia sp.]